MTTTATCNWTSSTSSLLASYRNPPSISPLSVTVFQKSSTSRTTSSKRKKSLLVVETPRMRHIGKETSSSVQISQYVMGKYNAKTQKMTLCPIPSFFILQSEIIGYTSSILTQEKDDKEISYMNKRQALVDTFGNKMSQRIARTQAENRVQSVSGGAAVEKALAAKVATALLTTKDDGVDMSRREALPPFDMEATTPLRVYSMKAMISTLVYDALSLSATTALQTISSTSMHNYLLTIPQLPSCLTSIFLRNASNLKRKKVMHLLLTSTLMHVYALKFPCRKRLEEYAEEWKVPLPLLEWVMSTFASAITKRNGAVHYAQAKVQKDKVLLHLLAMAVNVYDGVVDVDAMAVDLKRTAAFLGRYTAQLGCRVEKTKTTSGTSSGKHPLTYTTRAVLTVPLKFPQARKAGPSRR